MSSSVRDLPDPAGPNARADSGTGPGPSPGSGADLARVALQAARQATARRRVEPGASREQPAPGSRRQDHHPRDPAPLTDAVSTLLAQRAWQLPTTGLQVRELWRTAAKGLSRHVEATGFDTGTGILELRPESPAYATQVRLSADLLVQRINTLLGSETVLAVRILTPGPPGPEPAERPAPPGRPAPPAGDDGPSPGYQRALAAHRAARTARPADTAVRATVVRQAREQLRDTTGASPPGGEAREDDPDSRSSAPATSGAWAAKRPRSVARA